MMKVIGKDGKEYGPVTVEEIKAWIGQGRLDGQSKARNEGATEWAALGEMPEFRDMVPRPPTSVAPPMQAFSEPAKTSAMAIVSLVLGVLGLFTLGLTALVGLVLGIIALVRINKSQGRLSGGGLAIAGICVSGLMFLLLPLMAAMLLPALAKAKERAQTINCMNHMRQMNLALMMYATDHNNTLPPGNSWCDLIKPYTGGSTDVFHCPTEPGCPYTLNVNVANRKISELGSPNKVVLVFSSGDGWNKVGGRESAVPHKHERRKLMIGFADGHVESLPQDKVSALTW
jgi:prepilin-type processing-associated H-X9-DG protein